MLTKSTEELFSLGAAPVFFLFSLYLLICQHTLARVDASECVSLCVQSVLFPFLFLFLSRDIRRHLRDDHLSSLPLSQIGKLLGAKEAADNRSSSRRHRWSPSSVSRLFTVLLLIPSFLLPISSHLVLIFFSAKVRSEDFDNLLTISCQLHNFKPQIKLRRLLSYWKSERKSPDAGILFGHKLSLSLADIIIDISFQQLLPPPNHLTLSSCTHHCHLVSSQFSFSLSPILTLRLHHLSFRRHCFSVPASLLKSVVWWVFQVEHNTTHPLKLLLLKLPLPFRPYSSVYSSAAIQLWFSQQAADRCRTTFVGATDAATAAATSIFDFASLSGWLSSVLTSKSEVPLSLLHYLTLDYWSFPPSLTFPVSSPDLCK